LFWQKKDNGLRAFFINQIAGATEKERAWGRYQEMQKFVAADSCRQRRICEHFGETVKWGKCGECDVCAGLPKWLANMESTSRRGPRTRQNPNRALEEARFEMNPTVQVNEELREFLREWRRNAARQKMTAAFVVMHDATLDALCQAQPRTIAELRQISGMGEKKCEQYGQGILEIFRRFANGERASKEWHARPSTPSLETLDLLEKGHRFEEIAQLRGRKVSTVIALVGDLIEKGETEFRPQWIDAARCGQIREACARVGTEWLKPIKEALPEDFTYEEIRLVVADIRRRKELQRTTA
jgi:ATP-dependent DNA helicase RecQ